ncbi:MAG: redoxin family protein [Planctomycetia bacterium]|nr:redoxin family protein [Planctomycetia bacterium]
MFTRKTILSIAAVPVIAVVYVVVMGSTGACATCADLLSWATAGGSDATATTVANPEPATTVAPAGMFTVPLVDLEGRTTTLAAHAGRPMLIEVWATWCGPCRKVRSIIKEHEAALSEVATLVGVSVDQGGPAAVTRYLEKSPGPDMLEYMVTPEFRAAIKPLDTQNTIPKLVYVGPDGRIANLSHGVNSPAFMTALLRNLGRTKPTAAPDEAG